MTEQVLYTKEKHFIVPTEPPVEHCNVPDRRQLFEELYEQTFPHVAGFVSRMGGTFEEARDIFQDALIIFYEKTMEGTLDVYTSSEAYIMGIAKHLWVRKYKKDRDKVALEDLERHIGLPEEDPRPLATGRLLRLVELAGSKCLEMLQAFYYAKRSMSEITGAFGYRSVRSATVQKYKCLEKIRNKIKAKSMTYEDFTE